jgi:predicted GIY-YIG superfamily endonuclease
VPEQTPTECFCYIVECADGSYYTGWTTNPVRRLDAHNAGRGARYTRARRPVRLVLLESQDSQRGNEESCHQDDDATGSES